MARKYFNHKFLERVQNCAFKLSGQVKSIKNIKKKIWFQKKSMAFIKGLSHLNKGKKKASKTKINSLFAVGTATATRVSSKMSSSLISENLFYCVNQKFFIFQILM